MASAPVAASALNQTGRAPAGHAWRWPFGSRTLSKAEVLFVAFVIVQALDGAMSYVGVHRHGLGIEANPLVAWYLDVLGPGFGFTVAKLFAVTCGAVLYVTARHRWVALLTLIYIVFAVGPWLHLLSGN